MADYLDWAEQIGIVLAAVGFVMAIASQNSFILYSTVFLMGLFFGRIWYRRRSGFKASLFLIIMFFFLGFILGGIYANLQLITILLVLGIITSYWLHDKKIIRSIEF